MRLPVATAKTILQLLLEGSSIRSAERITGTHRDTICRLIVRFGDACAAFMDARMRNLELSHLQFDEQWTYVAKKQARLTTLELRQRQRLATCIFGRALTARRS